MLTEERWAHIVERHREMEPHQNALLEVIAAPDRWLLGRRPGEEWFYVAGGPSRWLKVVVGYEGQEGSVLTAFPRRSLP